MKNKTYFYCIPLILLVIFSSCEKDFEQPIVSQTKQPHFTDGQIRLGKQLENPYSVENMQKAWDNIAIPTMRSAMSEVPTTHLYLKFKPQDEEQLSILKNDTSIIWYDYPLDYEMLEEGGSYYHDPEVPLDQPTYQYTAVSVDHPLPQGVEYELLANLYIPEEQESGARLQQQEWIDQLVDEALLITDNLEPTTRDSRGITARRKRWRPAGTMKVWDDNYNKYVPIKYLKVNARRWFTTYTGITNSSGYYSCNGTFKRKANYSLQFERYDFEIRDAWLSTANINGPKKKGNWNLNMNGGKREFWATIFRATSHYYYDNIKGLRRPPQNSFWNTQLKLRAMYESNGNVNGSHCAACGFFGLGSAIKIYNPQNDSRDIYATTIHELAHASHWNMDQSNYNSGNRIVLESWARGVERELTRQIYSSYNPHYSRLRYTGVVHDMIDGYKKRHSSYYWTEDNAWVVSYKNYYDQVSGYTIRQIEDALYGEKYWNNWKNNIKNSYNNATENNLDASFSYWNTQ